MSDILTDVNRSPIEWVEIDQKSCSRTYGVAPCTAVKGTTGPDKCYNTRRTCQDPTNYNATTTTLRFCHNRGRIPDDFVYFPLLQSAKITPAKINPGGANSSSAALGTRSVLSLSFSDQAGTDNIVDPYLSDRDFDPVERGTFFTKWRARNPYWMHTACRYVSGYIKPDLTIENKVERTFFITDFSRSGDGASIKAKDVLTMALDDKAKAPKASLGKLNAAITDVATSATLTPAGIGDTDYPASGKVRIDDEVCSFTRAADVLTLTRGIESTTAVAHDINATVQLCLEYSSKAPDYILNDLLTNYTTIGASYLDTTQWAAEVASHLPRLYSALITSPEGVTKLINEICEQMYFFPWWDDKNALLKIRALRPAEGETITELNDRQHLLSGSINWTDKPDLLKTQVWVFYAQKDPTRELDEIANYSAIDVISDSDAESADKYNTQKIKQVFSRWMTASDGATAVELGQKVLARYNHVPKEVTFKLDAKDGALNLTDFITIENRHNVDFYGLPVPVPMQVISAEESVNGTTFSYTAQEYSGQTITDPDEFTIDIASDLLNVNLRTLFDSKYAHTPISGDKIRFTVRSGVTIGGTAFSSDENIDPASPSSPIVKTYIANYRRLRLGSSNTTISGIAPILQRKGLVSSRSFSKGSNYTSAVGATNWGSLFGDIEEVPISTALNRGTWPAGVELFLDIDSGGMILGEGGSGSFITTDLLFSYNVPGGDGGNAIDTLSGPITINNLGIIGGGGGAGSSLKSSFYHGIYNIVSGGGGAGYDNSLASIGSDSEYIFPIITNPSGGNKDFRGLGGSISVVRFRGIGPFTSGAGGNIAEDGQKLIFDIDDSVVGKAGAAVVAGASNITWVTKGDVRGSES